VKGVDTRSQRALRFTKSVFV